MGPLKLKVDMRRSKAQFDQVMAKYLADTGKDAAKVLNTKSAYIIHGAAELTKHADKADIRKFIRSAEGQAFVGRLFGKGTMLKNILAKSMPDSRKEATKRIIAARNSSVGYIRAGWVLPLAIMRKSAKARIKNIKMAKMKRRDIGTAKPARKSMRPVASFYNLIGQLKGSRKKKPGQKATAAAAVRVFGLPALKKSFERERNSMLRYFQSVLRKTAAKRRLLK